MAKCHFTTKESVLNSAPASFLISDVHHLLLQDVLDKCHLSAEFFTAFLHQNYLEFYSTIDDLVSATAYLSDADYLTIDWAVSCFLGN